MYVYVYLYKDVYVYMCWEKLIFPKKMVFVLHNFDPFEFPRVVNVFVFNGYAIVSVSNLASAP